MTGLDGEAIARDLPSCRVLVSERAPGDLPSVSGRENVSGVCSESPIDSNVGPDVVTTSSAHFDAGGAHVPGSRPVSRADPLSGDAASGSIVAVASLLARIYQLASNYLRGQE
jgi:hypothetical protein